MRTSRVLGPCLAIALAACGATTSAAPEVLGAPATQITGREARALVHDGAILLDVRSSFEYAIGHLDGAVNIPVDELAARASELDPDAPIVVYCLSGHRSERAGRILDGAGLRHVQDLGSITNY
jgi:rhodanese-related sulfurtransferase